MKKRMLVSVALGIGAFALSAGVAMAGSAPGTGIIDSVHDLSENSAVHAAAILGVGTADTLSRVCIYCHAPHRTQKPSDFNYEDAYLPLWNRPVNANRTFTMYNNGSNPGSGKHMSQAQSDLMANNITRPGFVSLLCLSCHDGTVATNVYGSSEMSDATWVKNQGRVTGTGSIGAAAYDAASQPAGNIVTEYKIGANNDLSNHHPVGFNYNVVWQDDDEIANVQTQFGATGIKIADVLYNGNMECVTCHDVHNSTQNMGEKLLWTSNMDSAFCCTCHLKCDNKADH